MFFPQPLKTIERYWPFKNVTGSLTIKMVGGDSDTKMLSPFHNARDVESEKLTEGSSAEPHEVDTASLPLLATVHTKTKKTRRFIVGACIVAVLFVIATCVPLYFG